MMNADMKNYFEMLSFVKEMNEAYPDANLSWPFMPDGTPVPPSETEKRREATQQRAFQTCKRPDCRRHRRCTPMPKKVTVTEQCQAYYATTDASDPHRWAKLQFSRVLDAMTGKLKS